MAIDVEERRGKERKGRHIGKQCCIVRVAAMASQMTNDGQNFENTENRQRRRKLKTPRYIHTRTVATYLANIADVELSTVSANFINT